nr:hypothetical protein [Thermoproteota archaeon]
MQLSQRRWLRGLLILALTVASLLVALVLALQIPVVATWAARRLVTLLPLASGYRLAVGRADGDWLTGLRLQDVRLLQDGRPLAQIDRLQVGYDLPALLGSAASLHSLTIDGGRIVAGRENGSWNIANAFHGGSATAGGGGGFTIHRVDLHQLQVLAHLGPGSDLRVRNLEARATDVRLGPPVRLQLDELQATVVPPGKPSLTVELAASGAVTTESIRLDSLRVRSARSLVAGRVTLPRDWGDPRIATLLQVRLRALPLALADISAFYPKVVPAGDLRLQVNASANGRLATATIDARLDEATLQATGSMLLGSDSPVRYQVSSDVQRLDPSALLRQTPGGSLSGHLAVDLVGKHLSSAGGTALLRLHESRLGTTRVSFARLAARINRGRAEVNVQGKINGSPVQAQGWIQPFDSTPRYRVAGVVRSIPGTATLVRGLPGVAGNSQLETRFRLVGRGVRLDQATLSARLRLGAVGRNGERIVIARSSIRLDHGRLRARPELHLAGGRISGRVLATLGDTLHYQVRGGSIQDVNLGLLLGDSLVAAVSGRFTLEGRGIAPNQAWARARLQLNSLRYGERRVAAIAAQAGLRRGRVLLSLTGDVGGGTMAVAGAVEPFATPKTFSVDSAALRAVDLGSFLGRPAWSGPVTL